MASSRCGVRTCSNLCRAHQRSRKLVRIRGPNSRHRAATHGAGWPGACCSPISLAIGGRLARCALQCASPREARRADGRSQAPDPTPAGSLPPVRHPSRGSGGALQRSLAGRDRLQPGPTGSPSHARTVSREDRVPGCGAAGEGRRSKRLPAAACGLRHGSHRGLSCAPRAAPAP